MLNVIRDYRRSNKLLVDSRNGMVDCKRWQAVVGKILRRREILLESSQEEKSWFTPQVKLSNSCRCVKTVFTIRVKYPRTHYLSNASYFNLRLKYQLFNIPGTYVMRHFDWVRIYEYWTINRFNQTVNLLYGLTTYNMPFITLNTVVIMSKNSKYLLHRYIRLYTKQSFF